mmetsp:Transcript_36325/g.82623  ORF Transcript_36325/g.82623 Transcript_36325/m.82623 type:complete len:205 (+) Transcript_36325:624-1238(+)
MPFSRAAISSARVAIAPLASSMALPKSDAARSSSFLVSSFLSNSASQYAFFWWSLACSSPSMETMSSIILMTFSKLTFFPRRASTRKSTRGSADLPWARLPAVSACNACCRTSLPLALVCNNEGLGKVFLKSSSASSSFRTLIVPARATSSSARVFLRSSHSAVFVSQLFSRPARNFLSSARAASVSERSSFMVTIATPNSPIC